MKVIITSFSIGDEKFLSFIYSAVHQYRKDLITRLILRITGTTMKRKTQNRKQIQHKRNPVRKDFVFSNY